MRKILALLLMLAVLFALTACAVVDNNETEAPTEAPTDADSFVPEPAKYTRDEFLAELEGYMGNHKPDKKSHYEEGYDPKEENGFKEIYIVKDFDEEHKLNLFLHDTNHAVGQQAAGWVIIDRFRYEFKEQTTYTISLYYTIPCANLKQAVSYAKNDAYCIGPFYDRTASEMSFYATENGKRKNIALTDEVLEKLASGGYASVVGWIDASLTGGDDCRIQINITPTANGEYEYICKFQMQVNE